MLRPSQHPTPTPTPTRLVDWLSLSHGETSLATASVVEQTTVMATHNNVTRTTCKVSCIHSQGQHALVHAHSVNHGQRLPVCTPLSAATKLHMHWNPRSTNSMTELPTKHIARLHRQKVDRDIPQDQTSDTCVTHTRPRWHMPPHTHTCIPHVEVAEKRPAPVGVNK
jgi:hypothetical protein